MLWSTRNLVLCAGDHDVLQWLVSGLLAESRQRKVIRLDHVRHIVRSRVHGGFRTDVLNMYRQLRSNLLDLHRELRSDLFNLYSELRAGLFNMFRLLDVHGQLRSQLQHL